MGLLVETRTLGQQGLTSSALGYGAMGTVIAYGPTDDTESIAAIRRARELGTTHFDTAEMYGWGDGEKLLGKAVAPFRDEITIATKFGLTRSFGQNSQPDHIREVVDNSLRNLNVEVIDLLYQHAPDPEVPVEDVVGVMKELVEAGKVKYVGLSNAGEDDIRRGHAVHPISVLQAQYSIFDRKVEALFPVLDELGIGLVAYSPLARGFLTGTAKPREQLTADDRRHQIPMWAPENFEANRAMADRLANLADRLDVTLSQLALAWVLAQKDNVVPIPGSRNPQRVEQNIAATDITLSDEVMAEIAEIVPNGAHGA